MNIEPHSCIQHDKVILLEAQVNDLKGNIKEILTEVKLINEAMTKYRGFIGGITFIIGAVPIVWAFTKEWFMRHWQ